MYLFKENITAYSHVKWRPFWEVFNGLHLTCEYAVIFSLNKYINTYCCFRIQIIWSIIRDFYYYICICIFIYLYCYCWKKKFKQIVWSIIRAFFYCICICVIIYLRKIKLLFLTFSAKGTGLNPCNLQNTQCRKRQQQQNAQMMHDDALFGH